MKLIIILICLAIQALLKIRPNKNPYSWLDQYAMSVRPFFRNINADHGIFALIALLIPVLILILILNAIFGFAPLYLIYGVIVLLICLDCQDMKAQLSAYFDTFSSENLGGAQSEAEKFVGHPVHQDKNEMSRAVTETIFTRSLANVFAIIFWFIVLGPFGAVLYYVTKGLTELSQKPEFGYSGVYSAAESLKEVLDWIPVRLVTLTFALIGPFGTVFNLWLARVSGGLLDNRQFLIDAGLLALHEPSDRNIHPLKENQNALGLVARTFSTWIIVIAVVTIISWL
jgi:AmpE protein